VIGRGIGVAGVWLGMGLAIGLSATGRTNLPAWVYQWVLIGAVAISVMLAGPWTWANKS
jgi:hypothetical protein